MVTKVSGLWGLRTGWRSRRRNGFLVTATLDGVTVRYFADDIKTVERAFKNACLRSFLRKSLPWLAPPPQELVLGNPSQASPFRMTIDE
jgi:hypothetical protein